ncbi:hypothetical protein AG0111_0g949 [Alternaria gaisen]|uniref:Uncharacterized protein n=1 Tax=Alternaria gaisen TaxID=167740 RepID=A0ACB6FZ23_9PLEO|nr:hypothetical protein AG0111_0g949 [Alternaria gaisen]
MSGTWDWERCTSNCLSYTVANPGFYDELSCIASDFYCMCREVAWVERLVNGDVTPLACISENCAEPAKIAFAASVSLECSNHGLDVDTLIATDNILLTYFDAQPASTSMSPLSTNPTEASTSAFVPTTSSMLTVTRPSTRQPVLTQVAAEGANTKSEGLGAAATGRLAAGITIAGLAVIALIAWFVICKRRKAAQTRETPVVPSTQPDSSNEKMDYDPHQNNEPTHELQGDDLPTMYSHTSNRMSELDSVRPPSELDLTSPVSELISNQTDHDPWSANTPMPISPSSFPDVQEDEETTSISQPGRFSHIRTARASKSHRRFSSV